MRFQLHKFWEGTGNLLPLNWKARVLQDKQPKRHPWPVALGQRFGCMGRSSAALPGDSCFAFLLGERTL